MDSQKWSSHIVMSLTIYVTIKYLSHGGINALQFATSGVLLLEGLLLWLFTCRCLHCSADLHHIGYRPNTSSGVYSILLVPVALLGNAAYIKDAQEDDRNIQEIWLSLTSVFSVIVWLKFEAVNRMFFLMISMAFIFVFRWLSVFYIFTFIIQWKGITLIPMFLQKTFTLGEVSILLQLVSIWIHRFFWSFFQNSYLADNMFQLFWFDSIFVIAIVLATTFVCLSKSYLSPIKFMATYIVTALLALLLLFQIFNEDPISWFFNFVFGGCVQIFLMSSWAILFTLTIVWTAFYSLTEANNPSSSKIKDIDKFSVRKVFHILILLVYIPGLLMHIQLLLIASVVTFGVFVILETTRALQVPVLGNQLHEILKVFVDDRDQGPIFLTHIYLLLGLSLPLWLSPNLYTSIRGWNEMFSGVLSLGVGDSVACIFGSKFGQIYYPGSKKTVEGTLASIFSQIILVSLASYLGLVQVSSALSVLIGVSLSSLFEAFTDQIDNLMLPLALYPFLCYS
ncbi:dolichol kinase-like isoform X1 [Biomphalaria glabrata]|uniref:dolichol kinase n=1 Tax=Biomphalaria glabrata TaxID=6526 RepID=A0A9W2YX77_BIOGL|nr:dolichol kinase-like isoform X1 [Biomphalaria glabrata]XP_055867313.1 dolichol kinase-like isoform X1 [Biomphalaria glabrata]XP_055867322.1 dolichol kinase-like isoform X1 [Biomphalaria glabrata]XP_055867329.1 dolichol kinase-like isoform X1 [Biomphalaria glabrata]XP_055867338.1 dolichol kinase-like isoform X1 [Biomphalaria glabrata]XP_055867341.1 dolichol kinase-like isoform X1 [Biomphalaria glabrata]XP_055867347.1 dolichol kinase-like isoform X1 [Biomphalaria glabrata]XP_055867355.1 dol